jgi:hypothetical protein
MPELLHIAAFWAVVVVVIRLAVCFPQSLLARFLFSHHGPLPVRGESQAAYFLRCARFDASWFMQAVFLFVVGWVALQWDASPVNSLFFLVLWAVVVPALGGVALLAAIFAVGRSIWVQWLGPANSTSSSAHAGPASFHRRLRTRIAKR